MKLNLDPDFFQEETRCDFLVTKKQKKIWAVELEILSIFDEICKKYNLQYFVDYGTLLGAIRHNGFIPWDGDLDITMFRPDYEKLKQVIQEELPEPYFFQNAYTDSILFSFSKIRDRRTAAYPSALPKDILQELIDMPVHARMKQFEAFLAGQFNAADELGLITTILFTPI